MFASAFRRYGETEIEKEAANKAANRGRTDGKGERERAMLCCHCKKNQATKKYDKTDADGKKFSAYYCPDCYRRLFVSADIRPAARKGGQIAMCPYCGATEEEFKKTGLVGCAECYRFLSFSVLPVVVRLQGDEAHCGEGPEISDEREWAIRRRNVLKKREEELMKEGKFDVARKCHEELKRLNDLLYKGDGK